MSTYTKKPSYGQFKKTTSYQYVTDVKSHIVVRRSVFKTNAGGRIRRLNIITVAGNAKLHKVGLGASTSANSQTAMRKAESNAIKKLQNVKVRTLNNGGVKTVEQRAIIKSHGLKLIIRPVFKPNLICANNTIKKIGEEAGLNAFAVKVIGKTSAKQNQAAAFIHAITTMESPRDVAARTGLSIESILERDRIYSTLNRRTV